MLIFIFAGLKMVGAYSFLDKIVTQIIICDKRYSVRKYNLIRDWKWLTLHSVNCSNFNIQTKEFCKIIQKICDKKYYLF